MSLHILSLEKYKLNINLAGDYNINLLKINNFDILVGSVIRGSKLCDVIRSNNSVHNSSSIWTRTYHAFSYAYLAHVKSTECQPNDP